MTLTRRQELVPSWLLRVQQPCQRPRVTPRRVQAVVPAPVQGDLPPLLRGHKRGVGHQVRVVALRGRESVALAVVHLSMPLWRQL